MVDPRVRREREELEAALEKHVYAERIASHRGQFADADFWRQLCPDLTISDFPFSSQCAPLPVTPALARAAADTLATDGYFTTGPLVRPADSAQLLAAATRLVDAGFPSTFACLYDAFWRLFQGLESLLAPMLGEDYLIVPDGLWTFFVPKGDTGLSGWSSLAPHRDSLGPDRHLLETGRPGLLNLWIALTDATPLNSCIYVLPGSLDESYLTTERGLPPAGVGLRDVRALPAAAGSVLGWSSHLLHWGSRSSSLASEPRASAALYVQRRDLAPYAPEAFAFGDAVPFPSRLRWLARSAGVSKIFGL